MVEFQEGNKILENLKKEEAEILYKAYSQAYESSKWPMHVNHLFIFLSAISPVLVYFTLKDDIKIATIAIGFFWLLFSLFFEDYYKKLNTKAAQIHQEFDYFLFGWEWNVGKNGRRTNSTKIADLSAKYKKERPKDWFSKKIDKSLNKSIAILFAFLHTLFQETKQRQKYINILYLVFITYYFLMIFGAIALEEFKMMENFSVSDFFLVYALPTTALAKYLATNIKKHNKLLAKQEEEYNKITDFLENYRLSKQLPDEKILQNMQDFLFEYRKKGLNIPSWLYSILNDRVNIIVDTAIEREKKLLFPEKYKENAAANA